MDTAVEGLRLVVEPEEDAPHPRKEWDGAFGTVALFIRDYDVGDDLAKKGYPTDPHEFRRWVTSSKQVAVRLEVYSYVHSGISITAHDPYKEVLGYPFTDRWDAGLAGYAFCTKQEIRDCMGLTRVTAKVRERAKEWLREEVETLNKYLNNDVYWVQVVDNQDNCLFSCGNVYDPLSETLKDLMPHQYQHLIPASLNF